MNSNLNVAMTLSLQDQLIGPLNRMVAQATKTFEQLEKSVEKTGKASDLAAANLTKLAGKADGLGKSRGPAKLGEDLKGVEKGADEAARKVGKLKALMADMANLARPAVGVFAGMTAAKMTLAAPMQRAADYELDLARASNIAFADEKTVAGRQAGQRQIDGSVRMATKEGVTRDDALLGLKTLIGAGTDRKDAMAMLPTLAKFSMAGEAAMKDVANIAVKAQQTFNIKPDDMGKALQMALSAGKAGQFEFKDMANWLPEQMAISKNMLGMQGLGDLSSLLAANQFAAKSAGSNNAAGNNLVNFLSKINSSDTQNDAKKLGIDLTGSLAAAREKGVNPIDAFVGLMKKTAETDPAYNKIQSRLQTARESGDKKGETETLGAMRDLMMGKSIGKLVQDRQALLGLLGILNDPKGFAEMRSKIGEGGGGVDVDQATLMATASMKNQQAENALLNRQFDGLQSVNQALGDAKVAIAKLSDEYPNAAAALEVLKLAAIAAAAGIAAMGLANLVTGAGAGGLAGAAGRISGTVGGALAGGAMAGGAALAGAGALAAGAVGYGAGTLMYKGALEGNAGGDWVGDKVASLLAFFGNAEAKSAIASTEKYDKQVEAERAALNAQTAALKDIAQRPIRVILDGREIAAQADSYNASFARRN